MTEQEKPDLLLLEIWRAVLKRRKFVVMFVAVYMFILLCITILIPKKYESNGKMFVRLGRGGVTLDPTVTTSQTIVVQEGRESEINSIIDVMESRDILERVVLHPDIGPERILKTKSLMARIPMPKLSKWLPSSKSDDDGLDYERLEMINEAIEKVYDNLTVKAPRKASNISVSCRSESPKLSQQIVSALMETYIEQHVEARKTDGSFAFFEEQHSAVRRDVKTKARRLADFKNESGIMSIDRTEAALRDLMSKLERDLIDARAREEAAVSRYAKNQELISTVPENVELEKTSGVANQASDLMRDRLYELELQERDLANRYSDTHPLLVAIRKRLDEAQKVIENVASDRTEVRAVVNENLLSLRSDLLLAQTQMTVARSEAQYLQQQLAEANERLRAVNEQGLTIAELQRELGEAERNTHIYAEKLEEARINRRLDEQQISNIDVIQPASLQVKHVSPSYKLIILGGLMSAFAAAICAAYVRESLTQSSSIAGGGTARDRSDVGSQPLLPAEELEPLVPRPRVGVRGRQPADMT